MIKFTVESLKLLLGETPETVTEQGSYEILKSSPAASFTERREVYKTFET
ncbi:MAG: hypothetical protein IKL02_08605 [Kiritimatiellae bacterium]|nr:hypothetical protein [Kiritimatiellia bacterium]